MDMDMKISMINFFTMELIIMDLSMDKVFKFKKIFTIILVVFIMDLNTDTVLRYFLMEQNIMGNGQMVINMELESK